MRGHRWRLTASGAALGLAIAVAMVVSPASAAKPGGGGAVTASYTCATFEGLVLAQQSVSYTGVALRSGETITARVSPAAAGDEIILTAVRGSLIGFSDGLAAEGLAYTAPGDGSYNFAWSLEPAAGTASSSLTWTFDCSSTSGGGTGTAPVIDADADGVPDASDACPATALPDSVSKPAAGRYYATSGGWFVDGVGTAAGITVVDAGGCSAAQIAKGLRLSPKDAKSGVTLDQLQRWAAGH